MTAQSARPWPLAAAIQTCKLNGVDVLSYLTDAMHKIAAEWPNKRLVALDCRPRNKISDAARAA